MVLEKQADPEGNVDRVSVILHPEPPRITNWLLEASDLLLLRKARQPV